MNSAQKRKPKKVTKFMLSLKSLSLRLLNVTNIELSAYLEIAKSYVEKTESLSALSVFKQSIINNYPF